MSLFPAVLARHIGRIGPVILGGMDSDQTRPTGDWRDDARAAVRHLASAQDLTPAAAAALLALDAALRDESAPPVGPVDAWPVLARTAQVHGTVFKPGTSSQAVVEEAVRYYEFEQQPARVASRESVLDRFGAHLSRLEDPEPEN
ncbi:hypothetical protein [Variovorax gossypii]|uniref:hypothetical protein n=1 Tax=uncultured Variovorax sp. TaxID=114708 RepID=UPI00262E0B45|nr:hypothetical protein [uncultured Variovorax sp.]